MKHFVVILFTLFLFLGFLQAQPDTNWCQTTGTPEAITPMVNVQQPVIVILVDFKDGRLSNGSAPTQDSDTSLVLNIDAVGSMG